MRKNSILFLAIIVLCSTQSFSQTDTLHIYFQGLQTKILDSNETKIGNWAKTLKGKHVDVEVLAYYSESGYKKYAQERADELFLILNRKARDLITIKTIGPKSGKKFQRSMADIVYKTTGSAQEPKEKTVVKKEDKSDKKMEASEEKKEKSSSKEKEKKQDIVNNKEEEKTEKKVDYIIDSVYVNGVLKITKRKIKKK